MSYKYDPSLVKRGYKPPSQRDRAPARRTRPRSCQQPELQRRPAAPINNSTKTKSAARAGRKQRAAEGAAPNSAATTRQGIKTSRSPAGKLGERGRRRVGVSVPRNLSIDRRRPPTSPRPAVAGAAARQAKSTSASVARAPSVSRIRCGAHHAFTVNSFSSASMSGKPRSPNTWQSLGGVRPRAGGRSCIIKLTASRRWTCSWFRLFLPIALWIADIATRSPPNPVSQGYCKPNG